MEADFQQNINHAQKYDGKIIFLFETGFTHRTTQLFGADAAAQAARRHGKPAFVRVLACFVSCRGK